MPKSKCANPLYLNILEEWRNEIEQNTPDNNLVKVITKAMNSLADHPTTFKNPQDCIQLPGFGPFTVKFLTQRLNRAKVGGGASVPTPEPKTKVPKKAMPKGSDDAASKKRGQPRNLIEAADSGDKSKVATVEVSRNFIRVPRAVPEASSVAPRTLGWDPYANPGGSRIENSKSMAPVRPSLLETELQLEASAANKIGSVDPSHQMSLLPQVALVRKLAPKAPAVTKLNRPLARTTSAPVPEIFLPETPVSLLGSKNVDATPVPSLGRTASLPLARSTRIEDTNDEPIFLTAAGKRRKILPRISSHIQPPPAIDHILEQHLDDLAGVEDASSGANIHLQSISVLPFTPIILPAGSYDIFLVLDSREIKSTKNRQYIQEELAKRGVSVLTRGLNLGDVCWIARPKLGGDDIVLDYIMERKRLDDLVGSIKDSRFHEQKFRLKQSGIGRIYYLVEEYEVLTHESMDKAVFTALSSTQIVDGFFLKETRDIEDTIEFLTGLHETIVSQHELYLEIFFQHQALNVIPDDQIRRHSYFALQQQLRNAYPETPYHTTFASFKILNSPGAITLRDFFARMLLCINGMSAEKTAAVIETYDTPKKLWQAFVQAEAVETQERATEEAALEARPSKGRNKKSQVIPASHMLTRLHGKGRRAIGGALSARIYELFCAQAY